MSEPTRYRVADNQAQMILGGNILAVDPAGPLVEYADYARLKAEVERLIYVGDMLATMVGHCEVTGDAHRLMLELSADWNAAKEGKQS